jgi:hypothetical protein
MRDAYHAAHPFYLSVEVGVTDETADERSHLILSHAHYNEAIAPMPEPRQIETGVAGEEGDISLPSQENNDFVVFHPLPADIDSDLSQRNPRAFQ